MDGTPRLRSAFPTTPRTNLKSTPSSSKTAAGGPGAAPTISLAAADPEGPVIPLNIIDGPRQRLYILAFYGALHAYRLWDYAKLLNDDADSLWLFLKWTVIDGIFIYGLPNLKVPWLEWSSTTTTVLFLLHALFDGFMMFKIPVGGLIFCL